MNVIITMAQIHISPYNVEEQLFSHPCNIAVAMGGGDASLEMVMSRLSRFIVRRSMAGQYIYYNGDINEYDETSTDALDRMFHNFVTDRTYARRVYECDFATVT